MKSMVLLVMFGLSGSSFAMNKSDRIAAYQTALEEDGRFENVRQVSVRGRRHVDRLSNLVRAGIEGFAAMGAYGDNTCRGDYIETLSFVDDHFSYKCKASVCQFETSKRKSAKIYDCLIKNSDRTMILLENID